MAALLDPTDPTHAKALRMLEHDLIAWFVTTAPDGTPRAVPVWFFWLDGKVYLVSEPKTGKVAAVRRGAPVLLHLQAGGAYDGEDVVILHGSARISDRTSAEWVAENEDAYLDKYREALKAFGSPLDAAMAQFSVLIVFTPERIQAW